MGDTAVTGANVASQASASSHQYRRDIDGLRAVAVVPVVLFHAGISLFSGGYVGVDVFFVISGFLITGILARSMAEGRYSIIDFYQRRARRIFPALAVMMLCTLAVGYAVLMADELAKMGTSALSIAGFVSNFHFWRSIGYFEAGSSFQPLLHTWSLAVEEQFYIFFPILLWFLIGRRRWLMPLLIAVCAVSFVCSVVLVAWKPGAAFYLLPSRAWELMAGGLLALGAFERMWSQRVALVASWIGLALILVPVFAYSEATSFPGVAAVPPVLGACLLIWARGEGAGRLLALGPLVWVGLLSYSLYLWHLPIFEFAKYLTDRPLSLQTGLVLSLASMAAAWLSLRFVEEPIRRSGPPQAMTRRAIVAWAGLGAIAAAGLAIVLAQGVPGRLPADVAAVVDVKNDKSRHHDECMSVDATWIAPASACRLGDPAAEPTALLWGDSHAMVTATSLEEAARRTGGAFLFAADADCPIGLGFSIDSSVSPALTTQGHYRSCERYNREMLAVAMRPEIRTVVLSSRWTNWRIGEPANPAEDEVDVRFRAAAGMARSVAENRAIFERGFTRLVEELVGAGKQVVIVGPVPEPTYNVPHRSYVSRFGFVAPPEPLSMADYQRRHATILAFLRSFEGKVRFVRPVEGLCRDGVCSTQEDGVPLYFDHNHLSYDAARRLAPLYEFIFAPPVVPSRR